MCAIMRTTSFRVAFAVQVSFDQIGRMDLIRIEEQFGIQIRKGAPHAN